ncbi:hypothetical protein LTR27_001153 [Elasticomyces elasticus]|nr:hypothetical protein LTR27_001153 [Elasticomyces elasticus]
MPASSSTSSSTKKSSTVSSSTSTGPVKYTSSSSSKSSSSSTVSKPSTTSSASKSSSSTKASTSSTKSSTKSSTSSSTSPASATQPSTSSTKSSTKLSSSSTTTSATKSSHEVYYARQPNEVSVVHQLEQINVPLNIHIDVSLNIPLDIDLDKPQQLKELKELEFDVPSIGDSPINNLLFDEDQQLQRQDHNSVLVEFKGFFFDFSGIANRPLDYFERQQDQELIAQQQQYQQTCYNQHLGEEQQHECQIDDTRQPNKVPIFLVKLKGILVFLREQQAGDYLHGLEQQQQTGNDKHIRQIFILKLESVILLRQQQKLKQQASDHHGLVILKRLDHKIFQQPRRSYLDIERKLNKDEE